MIRYRCNALLGGLVAAAALFVTSPAAGQAKPTETEFDQRFAAADTNGDGKLTKEEAKAGMPRISKGFDRLDKDKKGYLTSEQVKAVVLK